jgi:hypothetical protein
MAIQNHEIPSAGPAKPTREQALRIAEGRKSERRWRTRRLRRGITVFSVAAFIGPFGVIYAQLASGRDPTLARTQTAAAHTTQTTQTRQTTPTRQTTSPAPVTTHQS